MRVCPARAAHEHGALAVGDEVRAGEGHAALIRQVHLDVAAGELCRGSDPLVVYPEPDAVEEFDRGASDISHLPLVWNPIAG